MSEDESNREMGRRCCIPSESANYIILTSENTYLLILIPLFLFSSFSDRYAGKSKV